MRYIDLFSRFLVGGLFIFSGLIKINDPIGTEIKMEEYFEVFSSDLAKDLGKIFDFWQPVSTVAAKIGGLFGSISYFLVPWSLEIGMIMIVLELALGAAIMVNYRMTTTTWVLIALMTFFTFLTFYSAYFNKVTDCGCFGDAIKLTPWESFTKDVILMVFVLHLFWHRRRFTPVLRSREGHAVVLAVILVSTFLGVYAINHLPFIDFRAYREGNHIPTQMLPPEQPITEYVFVKDGKEVTSQKYLPAEEGYQYKSFKILNEERTKPKITDYNVTTPEGEDVTQWTFEGPKLILTIYDAAKASTKHVADIRELTRSLEGKVDCLILTASSEEAIDNFRHENQLGVPFYFADATVLKTIIRSNPGISLWKDGVVLGNWHHNDTPTASEILEAIQ